MKKKISKVWFIVGAIVIVAIAAFFLTRGDETQKISFDTSVVDKANIQNSVTATGTIEAVTTVTVGTQVSGIVNHLYVDYNSVVKKGQVIAELDKTNLLSQLNSTKAALASAKANVASAQDNVLKAQADLRSAEANIGYQRANFNRYTTLYKKGLNSLLKLFSSALLAVLLVLFSCNSLSKHLFL
jgi:efflux transporter, RND family, MFP subunit